MDGDVDCDIGHLAPPHSDSAKTAPKMTKASQTSTAEEKYSDPELRDRIKEELMKGDKGGKPGQWSARKVPKHQTFLLTSPVMQLILAQAQMMASEYKKRGGAYKGPKDEKAKHLDQWTKEDWLTKDGDKSANDNTNMRGVSHRYLPRKAWEMLDEEEKEVADKGKVEGSLKGEQKVLNTEMAKRANARRAVPTQSIVARRIIGWPSPPPTPAGRTGRSGSGNCSVACRSV